MQEVQVTQVNCERNMVAHTLVQLARKNVHSAVWSRQVPLVFAQLASRN
jgi:hypothetical protein